jgi:hypothetical protein
MITPFVATRGAAELRTAAGLAVDQVFGDQTIAAAGKSFPAHGDALHLAAAARAADDKNSRRSIRIERTGSQGEYEWALVPEPQTPTLRAAVL